MSASLERFSYIYIDIKNLYLILKTVFIIYT